jgi:hypothetical protein
MPQSVARIGKSRMGIVCVENPRRVALSNDCSDPTSTAQTARNTVVRRNVAFRLLVLCQSEKLGLVVQAQSEQSSWEWRSPNPMFSL